MRLHLFIVIFEKCTCARTYNLQTHDHDVQRLSQVGFGNFKIKIFQSLKTVTETDVE